MNCSRLRALLWPRREVAPAVGRAPEPSPVVDLSQRRAVKLLEELGLDDPPPWVVGLDDDNDTDGAA